MATLTARLDDWLKQEIEEFWRAHGEGPSAGLRHVVEEWWAMLSYPSIEFRDGIAGRRARLRGGPDVWEVAMVAAGCGADRTGLYEHFAGFVSRKELDEALAYAERFPEGIQRAIAENARIESALDRAAAG
ncbi:MAG: hypothetical protein ACRENI_07390 [Gemmatimonadaceae bacterium]